MPKEMNAKEQGAPKKTVRNDLLLVGCVLLIVLIAALALILFRREGDTVSVDGQAYGEYSLNEDQTIEIKTDLGYNLLIIKDGKAYIEEASCPDGICRKHRPIAFGGQSIICLPNKVVINLVVAQDDEGPDAIV